MLYNLIYEGSMQTKKKKEHCDKGRDLCREKVGNKKKIVAVYIRT